MADRQWLSRLSRATGRRGAMRIVVNHRVTPLTHTVIDMLLPSGYC